MTAVAPDPFERWALDYMAEHRLAVVPSKPRPAVSSWYETPLGRLAYPSGPIPSSETPGEAVRRVMAELGS